MIATAETHLDRVAAAYVDDLAGALRRVLGDELLAVYVIGSGAIGGWLHGRSDIDVNAVCARPLDPGTKRAVAAALSHAVLPCPAPRLEFVLYARGSTAFEVNLNTGPSLEEHVTYDPADESPHWFVLDRAVGERAAVPVVGPPWRELFPPVRREDVLAAQALGLAWQEQNEPTDANTVLACCRAWRYADEGVISSKVDAALWARDRVAEPALVDAALALKRGEEAALDATAVSELLRRTRDRLARG